MKKLIFVLALMFTFVISNAQVATVSPAISGGTIVDYPTSITLTNTTAKYMIFAFDPAWENAQSYIVQLDSASGDHTNVAIAVYGRVNSLDTWTAIGSAINWKGKAASTGMDTTIKFTNSTEYAYRQFKVLFTGTGTGTTTIANQTFKIWYGTP